MHLHITEKYPGEHLLLPSQNFKRSLPRAWNSSPQDDFSHSTLLHKVFFTSSFYIWTSWSRDMKSFLCSFWQKGYQTLGWGLSWDLGPYFVCNFLPCNTACCLLINTMFKAWRLLSLASCACQLLSSLSHLWGCHLNDNSTVEATPTPLCINIGMKMFLKDNSVEVRNRSHAETLAKKV